MVILYKANLNEVLSDISNEVIRFLVKFEVSLILQVWCLWPGENSEYLSVHLPDCALKLTPCLF